MEGSAERAFFQQLEERLAGGEPVEAEVSVMLLAGQDVEVDEDGLRGATRRAIELLATGGDPRRELDPDGRAVAAFAEDLDSPARRSALEGGLASVRRLVEGLPSLTERVEALSADDALAWRWFACTLLAEELLDE
jgi:ADP-ribose pyrophosphatase YjhB (NUDIX family)